MILAGGLGTRLRGVFDGPKCLAPIGGSPFLSLLLEQVRDGGFEKVMLCVGHKSAEVMSYVKDGRAWGLDVSYSVETTLLGTGGAVRKAKSLLAYNDGHILVLNGDSYSDVNFSDLLEFHLKKEALVTMAVVEVGDRTRYGAINLDSEKKVSFGRDGVEEGLVNAGVYILAREVLSLIWEQGVCSLEKDILPYLPHVYGYETDGYFIDIGVPGDYSRAQVELLRKKAS